MKIGILGGSFDPIHNGHLHMALQSKIEYNLDKVFLMPAGHSPNKDEARMTSAVQRAKMCQLATLDLEGIETSEYEVLEQGKSYTYLTLTHFKQLYPTDELYFIMGADSLDYFEQWRHPEIICENAIVLVVNRGDFLEDELIQKIEQLQHLFPCDIRIVHCDKYTISSSEIRQKLANHLSVEEFVPARVVAYIEENNLYR